ncbi:MAG: glycoside hydrolase family 13 protein [Angelakisella sp.]
MIFNSRDLFYKTPFGAVPAGTPVTLRLVLPKVLHTPVLQVFRASALIQPAFSLPMEEEDCRDDVTVYSVVFTPPQPELLFYRFSTCGGTRIIGWESGGVAAVDDSDLWQLTVYDPAFSTPKALRGGVFYQIFPDRFCSSGTPKENVPADRILHTHWHEAPVDGPDEQGEFLCNDYFGGDLLGIAEKMPYLASLGVEGIYLNPIFEAHSNHRYNTADYRKIDPLLGRNEDFQVLCDTAHSHGIHVILDGVFNHTGSDSIYFNKEKRYGETGAYNDPESPYKDWFSWIEYPHSYHSWWGFQTLPDLREDCPSYREFICREQGVLRSWLRAGADGFRLDVADELPDDFIAEIRTAIKTEKPDALLLGEVWEDASNKQSYGVQRQYFQGAELDSVMNYPWRTAILSFIRYGGGAALREALYIIMENYPAPVLGAALNSLSTHDVARAITALCAEEMGGKDRDWQRAHNTLTPEQFYTGRQLFLLASVIQYTLPGCPCLYYGDEAGLVGYADPFNRGTYPWGREDSGMVEFFRLLGQLRKNSEVLRHGSFTAVDFSEHCCTYLREQGDKKILISVNRGTDSALIPYSHTALENAKLLLRVGSVDGQLLLRGHSAAILEL